ncbi:MAG: amidohydrolase [Acidobacteriota bacterium]
MSSASLALLPEDVAELISTRRQLHKHPELKFQEVESARLVAERLQGLGYQVRTGIAGTGVVGLLETGREGPTVMLRADMDALPITEENSVEYASQCAGVMHACGHDGHVAALLATAKQLIANSNRLRGTVKLVFQPGEEGGNGALKMIEEGVLESPHVDAAFGLHVWNNMPVGKIGVVTGPLMASVDEFHLVVKGRGGHGAMPHQTVDAILVASQIVCALQTIVSRQVNPLDCAVVTVGSFHAGSAFNIIAETAELRGTVRTFSRELYQEIPELFKRIVQGTATALGAQCEIKYERQCLPTINDANMAELVRNIAAEVVGADNVISDNTARTMGGEDMSFFLERVPGCFFFVGSQNTDRGLVYPHHSPKFDFDEAALPIGTEILLRIALQYLKRE